MAKVLRGLVSKKKKRFSEDGFDLDLSYITPQIIAMGYPTKGREAAYRNPYKQVYAFLEKRHHGHYMVYNLCSEKNRQYDAELFHGNLVCFPFQDHHPPPFDLIEAFCKDLKKYLDEDPKNVAAIHCKAGKGRTGTMIIAYLIYSRFFSDPEHSKRYYALMRTYNRKGLTIPSQIRYVDYFAASLIDRKLVEGEPPILVLNRVKIVPPPFLEKLELLRFTVHCDRKLVYDHEKAITVAPAMVATALRTAQQQITEAQPTKDKLEKRQSCHSCTKLHATKDSVWVVCSLCGADTCSVCTKKMALDLGGDVREGPVERLVCSKCHDKVDEGGNIAQAQENAFMERFRLHADPGSDEFAIVLQPNAPIPIRGDVKFSIYHREPKPFIHFWINTRFVSCDAPLVFTKYEVDGAHKDYECKNYPMDFRLVADVQPATNGEQVIPLTPAKQDSKKNSSSSTVSGFVIEPSGAVAFNKDVKGPHQFGPNIAFDLVRTARAILFRHAEDDRASSVNLSRSSGRRASTSSSGNGLPISKACVATVAASLDYGALLGRLGTLNMVKLDESAPEELLAFWLNVYHLLFMLSLIECFPQTPKDRMRNSRHCGLFVSGERLTLMQIEYGILRSGQPLPSVPSQLLPANMQPRALHFGRFLKEQEFLAKIVTFGMSYFCSGTPGARAYQSASVVDEVLENGAQYLQTTGLVISSKKQMVVISSYLEWFQSDKDAQNLQLAVSNWLHVLGPKFDQSLSAEMKNHETFRFKFNDNVMLDEVGLFPMTGSSDAEMDEGLHQRPPTLPELPAYVPPLEGSGETNL